MKRSVALLLLLSVHLVSASVCQGGWQVFEDNCYLFVNSKENWWGATESCKQRQAHLLMIKNAVFNRWIVEKINQQSIRELWTGGLFVTNGGYWEWSPSGERLTYLNWGRGEPNDPWHHNCLGLTSNPDHLWNDCRCNYMMGYVCQKPAMILWEEFQENKYMFYKKAQNWTEAQATCAQNQAHLAVVKKQEVHKWLVEQMDKYSFKNLWIGGRYVTNGGYWEWQPTGERFDDRSVNWVAVELSEIGYGECLGLAPGVTKFQWNETPCAANLTFACQKPENNRTQL